jgi:hypothetical protein
MCRQTFSRLTALGAFGYAGRMSTKPGPKLAPPPKRLRDRCMVYVRAVGLKRAVETLGVSKEALKNLLAEQPVRAGTVAVVEKNLPDETATV